MGEIMDPQRPMTTPPLANAGMGSEGGETGGEERGRRRRLWREDRLDGGEKGTAAADDDAPYIYRWMPERGARVERREELSLGWRRSRNCRGR